MEESNVLLTFSGKTLKVLNKMCGFVMSFTSYMANILKTFILDNCKMEIQITAIKFETVDD